MGKTSEKRMRGEAIDGRHNAGICLTSGRGIFLEFSPLYADEWNAYRPVNSRAHIVSDLLKMVAFFFQS